MLENWEIVANKVTPVSVSFTVYAVAGWGVDNSKSFSTPEGSSTERTEDAAVFAKGYLKWDGCMELEQDQSDDTGDVWHFCGKEDASTLSELIDMIYVFGAEKIEKWDADTAR